MPHGAAVAPPNESLTAPVAPWGAPAGADDTDSPGEPSLPRALLPCLPLLWQRVLFPGRTVAATAFSLRSLALLVVLPALLLYPCLSFPLFEPDEGRYAQIPREMRARGEWVVPYLQAEPYLDKPPLCYWLIMLSYRVLGVHDWVARLVPALAVHGTLLVTYWLGRRSLGERAAFCGAAALGLAPAFFGMGRLLILDGLLTFWVTLAVFSLFEAVRGARLHRGWWVLAAVATGLGVLTKGPVAVILLVPPVWANRWLRGTPQRAGWPDVVLFGAVVLLLALPWYVAVCLRLPEFARHFLWEHNVVRFLSPFDHLEPVWFYVPIVLFGLLPGTLLLVPFARFLLCGDEAAARRRSPEMGFFLLSGGWCLLFFSLSGCKLPTYILPGFPPLCLALGCFLTARGWDTRRPVIGVAAAALAVLALCHHVLVPWYARHRAPMGRPALIQELCGDPERPVFCYPRSCDSVAFYLRRDDLKTYRSKHTHLLIGRLRERKHSVVLCTHRHTLEGLRQALPPDLRIIHASHFGIEGEGMTYLKSWLGETALGLCDIAVIERLP